MFLQWLLEFHYCSSFFLEVNLCGLIFLSFERTGHSYMVHINKSDRTWFWARMGHWYTFNGPIALWNVSPANFFFSGAECLLSLTVSGQLHYSKLVMCWHEPFLLRLTSQVCILLNLTQSHCLMTEQKQTLQWLLHYWTLSRVTSMLSLFWVGLCTFPLVGFAHYSFGTEFRNPLKKQCLLKLQEHHLPAPKRSY